MSYATSITNLEILSGKWRNGEFPRLPKADLFEWTVDRLFEAMATYWPSEKVPALKNHRQWVMNLHRSNFASLWQAIVTPDICEAQAIMADGCIDMLKDEAREAGHPDVDPDDGE